MSSEIDNSETSPSDIESGVSAIQELIPDMDEAAIRRAIDQLAGEQGVDAGTCAQIVRTELEAGRLPVEEFRKHCGV